ncbi:hypothetical protein CRUP_022628, partial [Coryphaenoides rupestris]
MQSPKSRLPFPFLLPKIRCQYSYYVLYLWLMSKVHHSSVDEEELRRKIREELQERLGEELQQKKRDLQLQLEEVKARARAEARAAAQLEVQEQVKQTLEAERADYEEKLKKSILTERVKSEDQRLIAQLYWMELKAHKLDQKERALKEQDELFKKHIAKLEEKRSQFYKITAESFQKGKEETHSRFARFSVNAACGDLQSRVMNCYGDNPGRTLACSSIAAAYMQCVADAKTQNRNQNPIESDATRETEL